MSRCPRLEPRATPPRSGWRRRACRGYGSRAPTRSVLMKRASRSRGSFGRRRRAPGPRAREGQAPRVGGSAVPAGSRRPDADGQAGPPGPGATIIAVNGAAPGSAATSAAVEGRGGPVAVARRDRGFRRRDSGREATNSAGAVPVVGDSRPRSSTPRHRERPAAASLRVGLGEEDPHHGVVDAPSSVRPSPMDAAMDPSSSTRRVRRPALGATSRPSASAASAQARVATHTVMVRIGMRSVSATADCLVGHADRVANVAASEGRTREAAHWSPRMPSRTSRSDPRLTWRGTRRSSGTIEHRAASVW